MIRVTSAVVVFSLAALLMVLPAGCRQDTEAPPTGSAGPPKVTVLAQEARVADQIASGRFPLTDSELAEGWISLFDGQTLFGWSLLGDGEWCVEEGAITPEPGDAAALVTKAQFADCVLRLEFLRQPSARGGVMLAASGEAGDPRCYEVSIGEPDDVHPTGSLVDRSPVDRNWNRLDWQSLEVRWEQGSVRVSLDGDQVLEYTDEAPLARGRIGLRVGEGEIAFRNIRLQPLGLGSLFNGRDLTGWKTYPEMASRFTVTEEGFLHVEDGRGQLETEQTFGDFILQLECITHAPQLNSGIFFRCIPGEVMNGYESQIHNGFRDNDRTQPEDCGTGGIFRRQDARRVVADDLVWFHKTIVVNGPHMAVWVNGYQVTDWTDTREEHANPRQGLRLEPGTIMIQGHDPTTDLSFRNLRAVELPQRRHVAR